MDVDAYLARFGGGRDDPLPVLVARHLAAVPFETLSIHLGEGVDTDPAALFDKIVVRRRGGFCHELNGLFAGLLAELGYDVALLGARVAIGDGGFTPPLAHVALRVVDDGVPTLVDVGFGRAPIGVAPLDALPVVDDGDLDVTGPDDTVVYRVETRRRSRDDFVPTCFWQATSPDSGFTHNPVCSLPEGDGRATLSGTTLIVTAADGTRTEAELDDAEALAVYRERFGIELDRLPVPLHPPG